MRTTNKQREINNTVAVDSERNRKENNGVARNTKLYAGSLSDSVPSQGYNAT